MQLAAQGVPLVVIADRDLLQQRARQLGIALEIREWLSSKSEALSGQWQKRDSPLTADHSPLATPLAVIHIPWPCPQSRAS